MSVRSPQPGDTVSEPSEQPWRRSDRVLPVNLDGYVFLNYPDGQPVVGMMGEWWYMALYSTHERLDAYRPHLGLTEPTVVETVGAGESMRFIAAARAAGLRIMIDPHLTDRGTTRWDEVFMDCEPMPPPPQTPPPPV